MEIIFNVFQFIGLFFYIAMQVIACAIMDVISRPLSIIGIIPLMIVAFFCIFKEEWATRKKI